MEKIKHEFFGELDLVNGLDDGMGSVSYTHLTLPTILRV